MQLPKTSGLVVWLLPAPDQSLLLAKLISKLSEQYNTLSFVPHVTLSSVPDISADKIIQATRSLANELKQVQVDTLEIECRSHPYRKVILPIDDNLMLDAFSENVNQTYGGAYCKESDFHLSLLYGNLNCKEIDLDQINRDMPEVKKLHIQSVAVVDLNFTPDKWKIIFEQRL